MLHRWQDGHRRLGLRPGGLVRFSLLTQSLHQHPFFLFEAEIFRCITAAVADGSVCSVPFPYLMMTSRPCMQPSENNDSQPMPGTDGFHPFYSIPCQVVSSTLLESPLVYIGTKGMKRNNAKSNCWQRVTARKCQRNHENREKDRNPWWHIL